MTMTAGRGVTPQLAATLRRWARRWLAAAVAGTVAYVLIRLVTAGPTLHDWEPPALSVVAGAVILGAVAALRWEGLAGFWLACIGVVVGVATAAHYGPYLGLIPVVAVLPAAVLLILAWQHVRSASAMTVFAAALVLMMVGGGYAAFAAYASVFGPSHPESSTPPPQSSPVEWMWAGGTRPDGFTIVAGVDTGDVHAQEAELLLARSPEGPWEVAAARVAGNDGVVRFEVDGLPAATSFWYRVATSDGPGPIGEVATFAGGAADLTIAFSSCARMGSNGAVFDAIRAVDPDVYIVTGDLFYGDIGPNDPDAFRRAYVEALTRPAQAALYRATPIAYVWDDHDYAQNDADSGAASRPAAMEVYRELVPHHPLSGAESPIHQAFTIGRVRVIMTDTRSGRDPDAGTALGAEQLAWFEAELRAAAERYPLVIWVNPDPWIAGPDPGADHWGGFPQEREHLASLIDSLDFRGFMMLAGDAHMTAIDDGSNNLYGGMNPGFPVFHAGALDRPGSLKGGPYSQGAFPGGGQFGVVEIDDDGTSIGVRLSGRNWANEEIVSYQFVVPGAVQG
jgi:hypothetical protein